jgi:restriction system protein
MAYREVWETEVRHEGLGKYGHIRGSDKHVVEQKAFFQKLQWEEQWKRKLAADQHIQERNRAAVERASERQRLAREKDRQKEEAQRYREDRKQEGIDRDAEAKAALETLRNILQHTLAIDDAINWDQLKDTTVFDEAAPKLELPPPSQDEPVPAAPTPDQFPPKPVPEDRPKPPDRSSSRYQPDFGLLDKLVSSRKARKMAEAEALFQQEHAAWVSKCAQLDEHDAVALKDWETQKRSTEESNAALTAEWERRVEETKSRNSGKRAWWEKKCEEVRIKHAEATKKWERRRELFYERQKETNAAIDRNKENYLAREQGAVVDYCDSVLSNSIYPDYFPKEWDLDYNADSRTLVVEYGLPAPESLPTVKEVRYVQTKDDFKETQLSEKERESLYDSLLYQITLRTIHELFEADTADALDAAALSGIVTALDRTTGHNVTACILSVLARKEAFMQINLADIDPKSCFKSLKGVAAAKLVGLSPVPPIVVLNKNDRRFVAGYGVADSIDDSTNLATMDWEDFEHLIRELFEEEFASGGGEVKVTQASRDGGVDAVAFDPDPIRGGKIVIQAKRYANTVGVSAVRDLYGTVMNEGAIKGILVTTADYGPDAYDFAKDKPLTLLSGANLLHLMEKHGHRARIDLHEAKQANKQGSA